MSSAQDHQYIFKLWHVRILCLVLAKLHATAKEESRHLGDLGADKYRLKDGTSVAPWGFRLMLVRVQNGGDSQVGLSRYYSLAREARVESVKALSRKEEGSDSIYVSAGEWRQRLRMLGLYISAMLIGMNDFNTAIDHLTTLYESASRSNEKENIEFAKKVAPTLALAYLQTGDTLSAREWFQKIGDEKTKAFTTAVCSMADADWSAASSVLEEQLSAAGEELPESLMVANNLAISRLHEGELTKAIALLENLVNNGCVTTAVLFNLFTLYDLLQEISAETKVDLLCKIRKGGTVALGSYEFLRVGLV
ncbi:hypothetical protein TRICI_005834 [Trichomonascus ciferrii]|uniref:Coatomer subunit epsilon n=1 Tax=Trichomonascus ciferrii TaxID=44093 RepID=A0A642UP62_9ASCO|nr:hypothetical protein TRICI_005834 [Trichomonascus ciferrii]